MLFQSAKGWASVIDRLHIQVLCVPRLSSHFRVPGTRIDSNPTSQQVVCRLVCVTQNSLCVRQNCRTCSPIMNILWNARLLLIFFGEVCNLALVRISSIIAPISWFIKLRRLIKLTSSIIHFNQYPFTLSFEGMRRLNPTRCMTKSFIGAINCSTKKWSNKNRFVVFAIIDRANHHCQLILLWLWIRQIQTLFCED